MNVDTPLQSVIQKMGNNFLVATFVPSMAFIVISSIAFDSFLEPPLKLLVSEPKDLIQSGVYLLLFTTILGFTLFSLSTYIYKAFEGYTFILGRQTPLRRSFLRRQKRRFTENERRRIWVSKQIDKIEKKIDKEADNQAEGWRERRHKRYFKVRDKLYSQQYSLSSERSENFPPELDLILPTRFGNILRSAEMYPGERYGIDAVPLWGRLVHVIPEESMAKLDEANNQCLFLLNAALLASVFACMCVIASVSQAMLSLATACNTGDSLDCIDQFFSQTFAFYFLLALLAGCVAWLFYSASLINVSQYGSMIRSSYDLYRFDLLKALHLNLPLTLKEEKKLWRRLSYFMMGNNEWERLKTREQLESLSDELDAGFSYTYNYELLNDERPKS